MTINVLSYLEASKNRVPERICWADAKTSLSYREAWANLCRMGSALAEKLHQTNRPVCVLLRHDVSDLLAFFSIVWSGNFYVPVDPKVPAERIGKILQTMEPAAIVGKEAISLPSQADSVPFFTYETLLSAPQSETEPVWKSSKDTDLLYVIFTSGSTGEPKGVCASHRAVIDMAEQFCTAFGFADDAVWGNQAPFDFDGSSKDIYISMKVGGTVHILEKMLFSFPKLLITRLNEKKINTLVWAVPALKIISSLRAFDTMRPEYVRDVLFSGEVLPPKALQYWMQALPQARLVNLYGPTEITCNCTYHIIESADEVVDKIPIGTPFGNCKVFLLDGDLPVTEEEKLGEICVTGSCLASGYYNRPALSAKAFVQNPLNPFYREFMYRTGDLGFLRGGKLMFAGRKDTQIKYMGHRIEMAEIELCANAADGVFASACVFDEEQSRLTLFYTGESDDKSLMLRLRSALPKYMLPTICKRLDAFPQNRTGKIDRKALLILSKEG